LATLAALDRAVAQTPPPLIRLHRAPDTRQGFPPAVPHPSVVSVGLLPVTGPREIWQVELHGSFGSLDEADKAQPLRYSGDVGGLRTSIAFHRNWWSTRAEEAMQALRRARYVQVTVIRIPVQAESELNELLRGRRASLDSINLDRPELVYQTLAGEYSGTFFILSPLSSLAALDEGVSRSAAAYLRSTGSPSQRSGAANLKSDISYETQIFRIDPAMSRVTSEFAELDPAFWLRN
jgi:hypothetical protein